MAADPLLPNPNIPPAVAAQAARATQLQQEEIDKRNAVEGDPPADPAPINPPAEKPTEKPVTPPQPQVDPPLEAEPSDDTWKHKFQSMKGRYDSDVPKFRGQIDMLQQQVNNLNRVIANLPVPSDTPAPEPRSESRVYVTPEEEAEYGTEFVDFASRLAQREIDRVTQPLADEVKQLRTQVGTVDNSLYAKERATMVEKLDEEVPNWLEINDTDEFKDWVQLTDPYSGRTRKELADAAFQQNDFPRVLAFFKGFLAELAATMAPQNKSEPTPAATAPRVALSDLAAPGRAKPAATPSSGVPPEQQTIITPKFITKFYLDRQLGRYKGRETEAADIEAQIFRAANEGRVPQPR